MKLQEMHTALTEFNRGRLKPRLPHSWKPEMLEKQIEHQRLEHRFIEGERALVSRSAAQAPRDPEGFVGWFEDLQRSGPGQNDPLFDWLANDASIEEMVWFLTQEVAGEAGFDDLVALTQVQLPARPKLEMARNYWDEMGRGNAGGMHGPMLAHLAQSMELPQLPIVAEALALGNLMMALACNRQYAYQAIGALGVIELTAPGRAARVNAGLKRLGIPADVRRYFAIHATLDVQHSLGWNKEVLLPLVESQPEVAQAISEGALMRLAAGARCFRRYREVLWHQVHVDAAE